MVSNNVISVIVIVLVLPNVFIGSTVNDVTRKLNTYFFLKIGPPRERSFSKIFIGVNRIVQSLEVDNKESVSLPSNSK